MNLVIPALAALGLLLIYDGITEHGSRRRARLLQRWEHMTAEAGMRHAARTMLVLAVLGSLVTVLIVAGITGSLAISVAIGSLAGWLPVSFVRSRISKRRQRFREAWPDAISTLVAAVRAGVSLPEACSSLVERGPVELRPGFAALASTYRATGSFAAALERLQLELADPIADRVVASLLVAREVGGTDLVRVLRTLGDFVRDDLRVRKEIEARWSWTVTAARVAAAAPWVVLLLMASRPEAARAYNSTTGLFVIAGGLAATALGYRLMLRAGRLPDDRRLTR